MAVLEDMEFDSTELAQMYYLRENPPGTFVFPLQYRDHRFDAAHTSGGGYFAGGQGGYLFIMKTTDAHKGEPIAFNSFPKEMLDTPGYYAWLDWDTYCSNVAWALFRFELLDGTLNRKSSDDFADGTLFDALHPPLQTLATLGTSTARATYTATLDTSGVTGSYCSLAMWTSDRWTARQGSVRIYAMEIRDENDQTVWSAGSMASKDVDDDASGTVGIAWTSMLGEEHEDALSVQPYRETGTKTEGDSSLGVLYTTAAAGTKLIRTFATAVDMRGADEVRFDVQSDRAGSNFDILLIDSDGGTHSVTPNLGAAGSWYTGSISLT